MGAVHRRRTQGQSLAHFGQWHSHGPSAGYRHPAQPEIRGHYQPHQGRHVQGAVWPGLPRAEPLRAVLCLTRRQRTESEPEIRDRRYLRISMGAPVPQRLAHVAGRLSVEDVRCPGQLRAARRRDPDHQQRHAVGPRRGGRSPAPVRHGRARPGLCDTGRRQRTTATVWTTRPSGSSAALSPSPSSTAKPSWPSSPRSSAG